MAGLKTLLGLYPKTIAYEQKRKQLSEEFNALNEYETSDELARFKELDQYLKSEEFVSEKRELLNLRYKGSDEYLKEKEFQQLSKDSSMKLFFKTASSDTLKLYQRMTGSDKLAKFQELQEFVKSEEFFSAKRKAAVEKKPFKNTEEYKKSVELKLFEKDPEIKTYFKFSKSKDLQNYNAINASNKLTQYEELKEYVKTTYFLEKKKYLSLSPKTRWKQSEPYARLQEFENLSKSEKIVWYKKFKDHKKFDWFRTWQLTFDDEFDTGKIDKNKWLTKYFWGEEILKDSYSVSAEKHFVTDGNNLEFNKSALRIITRKENASGKMWHDEFGFIPKEFDYTSGLINSGSSFRQRYGLFEAKIRFSNNPDVLNAFWMVGDKKLPHIDIAKADSKVRMGIQSENGTSHYKTLGLKRFVEDFHIFSIEWSPEKIVWKINGLEASTVKLDLPQQEMYVAFSSGVYKDLVQSLPSAFEVDWIKCYKE